MSIGSEVLDPQLIRSCYSVVYRSLSTLVPRKLGIVEEDGDHGGPAED